MKSPGGPGYGPINFETLNNEGAVHPFVAVGKRGGPDISDRGFTDYERITGDNWAIVPNEVEENGSPVDSQNEQKQQDYNVFVAQFF